MEPEGTTLFDDATIRNLGPIQFPDGIPAFETVKEFVLIVNEEEAPFLWLQAKNNPELAFITIDPFLVNNDYRPDIGDNDVSQLKITSQEEVLLLSIVNIHNSGELGITTNLVSPIVINKKARLGKQVILQNHLDYTVKHRIEQNS